MADIRAILQLGKRDDGRQLSSEEFAEAEIDEPRKYERVDGRLIVLAPGDDRHSGCRESWRDLLGAYRLNHPQVVHRVSSEAWVRVDGGTDRVADIGVYLSKDGNTPSIPKRVPDLVFEIAGRDKRSRERDCIEKRREYYRLGVSEYVIINPFRSVIIVLTWVPGGYADNFLDANEIYESPLLPGLAIRLSEVI
jgi:Uma2 family endonuclease